MERRSVTDSRKTGIDVVGDISWGTHICQLYQTREDLTEILVPFFKVGLENNEFCLWVTSEPLAVHEARAALGEAVRDLDDYLASGRIEILDFREHYSKAGSFDLDEVLRHFMEKERLAMQRGLDGLRAAGNTSWVSQACWRSFIEYESIIDGFMRRRRVIAICTYPLDQCGAAELVDVVSSHQNVLIRRAGNWEFVQNNGNRPVNCLRKGGLSYAEIGRILGLSRERVRQLVAGQRVYKKGAARTGDGLLTSGQAARFLNVHVNTLRRWSNDGVLPTYRVGNRQDRRFKRRELEEFLSETASDKSIAV